MMEDVKENKGGDPSLIQINSHDLSVICLVLNCLSRLKRVCQSYKWFARGVKSTRKLAYTEGK